jgi:hypothetical protein
LWLWSLDWLVVVWDKWAAVSHAHVSILLLKKRSCEPKRGPDHMAGFYEEQKPFSDFYAEREA